MHRILAVLALVCLAWAPDNFLKRDIVETQPFTRPAPTLATEGIDFANLIGFTVVLTPIPMTATFTGDGEVELHLHDTNIGWYRADSLTIRTLAKCAGQATCSFTYDVLQPRGRGLVATVGVTTSEGESITVRTIGTVSGKSISY